ncbi:unnamed protein product [Symbiodinium sp. CCMP2592]|nr:unnamed protein product [Symbiodinium sp. CCMP2592]
MPFLATESLQGVELVSRHGNEQAVQKLAQAPTDKPLVALAFYTMARISLNLFSKSTDAPLLRKQSVALLELDYRVLPCTAQLRREHVLCNVLQMHMTNLKLRALARHRTAWWCNRLMALMALLASAGIYSAYRLEEPDLTSFCCSISAACFYLVACIQCLALCRTASTTLMQGTDDDFMWWTARLLCANAFLVLLGPVLSFLGSAGFSKPDIRPVTLLTLDVTFQVCNVVLLSGMVGTVPMSLESLQKLAEFSGFSLSSSGRVACPGHISHRATDCVVSFPGKYSESWDKAVSSVAEKDAFSLACVFLTDAASGLGRHASNPDTPGKCWCHQIYGLLPASTYLSVVEIGASQSQCSQETLAFRRADAESMGQRLLVKQHQTELEWEQELTQAVEDAEILCAANQGRAPWGCEWFEQWKQNVRTAHELGQVLHVFYFKGGKGRGKMPLGPAHRRAGKERKPQD